MDSSSLCFQILLIQAVQFCHLIVMFLLDNFNHFKRNISVTVHFKSPELKVIFFFSFCQKVGLGFILVFKLIYLFFSTR